MEEVSAKEVISFLESPEGERWSREHHAWMRGKYWATIKEDADAHESWGCAARWPDTECDDLSW